MIALIEGEMPAGVQGVGRIELDDLDTGLLKSCEEFRRSGDGADAIVDQMDLHTFLSLCNQQIAELLAVTADVLENVVLQVQIAFCTVNGGEHCGECLLAIAQDADVIACE